MLWKIWQVLLTPSQIPVSSSSGPCASGRPVTAESWLNQQALPGPPFLGRADRVHSGKRQTINYPFFFLNVATRIQRNLLGGEKTDTLRETGGTSGFSQLSHRLLNQIYLWPMLGSKIGFRHCNPKILQGLAGIKNKECQTSGVLNSSNKPSC